MKKEVVYKKSLKFEPNLKDYSKTYKEFKFSDAKKEIDFFSGKVNAAYNAVDRHCSNKTALYWEDDKKSKRFSYKDLKEESNRFANLLIRLGVKKGDRVFFFLPRVPEMYFGFLGTLKMGAVAGTMFSAFGEAAIEDRLKDSGAKVLVTNKELVKRVYKVVKHLPKLKKIIITDAVKVKGKEVSYKKVFKESREFNVRWMKPDDYAYMLYTSGTTGKPKGVMHCHRDIIYQHITAKWILDLKESDVYWCTADPGWVTGIAYGILGPWSNNVTQVVYNGRFDAKKWYKLIDKYKVSVWYTAPTAIRMMMKIGGVKKLRSLRHMNSVGEPLNPEAIRWGLKKFKMAFHDNWWQTETGGILIANYPCLPIKLGSMGKPFPGITAGIVDDKGKELGVKIEGNLAIRPGWPSMMKSIWKNEKKYKSYFKSGWYFSGDKAFKDKDGYFWFIGRADDVIKTSGERVGPFEVESALIEHPAIAEAGVIGKPDSLRGQIIKAFVILNNNVVGSDGLVKELQKFVKKKLAGHAYPREIDFRDKLPKTRSGKIMRRMLKAEELGLDVGDVSTLED